MARGSKLGVKRGSYRQHTRQGKLTDDMVRHIRQSDQSIEELYRWCWERGADVTVALIGLVRRRKRKAGVPD